MADGTAGEGKPDLLIVDDTIANLDLLTDMLERGGYRARPVSSGCLAIQEARREPPDLILLDIAMPEMDGYEVCRRLKADPALQAIPVIFLSAHSEVLDKVQAFESGGVDYVTKPFQLEDVEARIETHLALRRLRTELEHQNQQLRESYEQLRDLEELRDSLTSMIVHDLRVPLASISGFLGLMRMRGGPFDREIDSYLEQAERGADVMLRMVNDLLDVSRLEAGQMPLEIEENDLGQVAAEALDSLGGLTLDREGRLDALESPLLASCDAAVARRVVANLVGNAIKYAKGPIQVTVAAINGGSRIEVRDTGPGIPHEFQDKIFEKFGQVEARRESTLHSTGLGLTFCKLAIEAHGGRIGVESVPDEGSTFWFELPAQLQVAGAELRGVPA